MKMSEQYQDHLIKRILFSSFFFFAFIMAFCIFSERGQAQETAPKELKVVFIAYQNPEQLVEDVKPIVKYLKETLKMNIKHFIATDYAGVVEALRNETADMGFMTYFNIAINAIKIF